MKLKNLIYKAVGLGKLVDFPVKVWVIQKYQNSLTIRQDGGVVQNYKTTDKYGDSVKHQRFKLRTGAKMPVFPTSFYTDFCNKRQVIVFQLDRKLLYPVSINYGKLMIKIPQVAKVPVINPKTNKQVIDKKTKKPVFQDKIVLADKVLFDSEIAMNDGKVMEIPHLMTEQTYDKDEWYSSEIQKANSFNRINSFFEKYSTHIALIIAGFMALIIFSVAFDRGIKILAEQGEIIRMGQEGLNHALDKLATIVGNVSATRNPY